ncbi:MAG TPA: hypothetical protein VG713_18455, partial [Pirellulales bacterium]|nr:hypothetical protein [Pirellulales bacterium]
FPYEVKTTDSGLLNLAALKTLKRLYISFLGRQSTYEALRAALPNCKIYWHFPQLQEEALRGTGRSLTVVLRATGETIVVAPGNAHRELADSDLERIVEINLTGDKDVRGPNVAWWLAEMTDVERLILDETGITDDELPTLESMTGLRQLSLRGTKVTADGVARLKKALPQCEITGP